MKKLILAFGAATLCSAGPLAVTDTPVTITGCVHAGTDPHTFVLLNVDEVTHGKGAPAGAVYWLSSTNGLKELIDRQVEVRGTYSLDRNLVKTAKLTRNSYPARAERSSTLENGMKHAETREERPKPVGTTGVLPTAVTRPYRRLDVRTIKMIAESCVAP